VNESVLEHGYSVSAFCVGIVLNQDIICSCCARLSGLARTYVYREGTMSWGFMVYGEYPRDRGCGGHTPQPFRSSFSANSVHIQQSVPVVTASSVHDAQLASTFGKLKDAIGNLGTLIIDNMSRNARSTRDSKQKLMSGHKFDTSKIRQYTGDYTLGPPDEYWLCPDSWTKHFRNLMLSCTISHDHWTHVVLMRMG
jgi:hypothetical protein